MTSAVAAVADPSVACALALPAEDVASSVAAPARAREVGWAQRAANVLFGAPSARRACGGAETSFTPESAAQREVAASARDGLGVRRGSQGRRRRGRSAPHLGERAGARRERAHVRRLLSLRRRPWRLARPGAGGGLFQRGSGPAGRGAPAPSRRLLPRGRDAPSACGGPGQHRGPLPSRRHLRGRSVRGGVLGRSGRSPGAPQGGHPLRRARLPALLLRRLSWSRRVLLAFGRSGGRGSGMRFLGGSGFLAVPASLRFGERAHRRLATGASTGNAALRLARAFELGRGCEQDFRRARTWYRLAAIGLGAAFDAGQWHFKRERIEARRGVARMAQEIAGTY